MFLHLGGSTLIPRKEVIAILNAATANSPVTEEFMEIAKDEGFVTSIAPGDKVKSVVITSSKIYLSSISCSTLKKRSRLAEQATGYIIR